MRKNGDNPQASLKMMLRQLKLPTVAAMYEEVALKAGKQGWSFGRYLQELIERELSDRQARRIARLLKRSGLPKDKTLATLEAALLPLPVQRQVPVLCEGGFVERAGNVLVFGLPGRGKTHVCSAVGHELVRKGYGVLFIAACHLVQRLLIAKRDLKLEQVLRQLDRFEVVIIDDIGYIQQDRAEMEVLFTFLAERYERRSVMISSNLVFSQWERIFKDPMTTAAAIDRLVHHATILELTGQSYRTESAKARSRRTRSEASGAGGEGEAPPPPAGGEKVVETSAQDLEEALAEVEGGQPR